jgi:uncharacterized damage-inducible protein DinB
MARSPLAEIRQKLSESRQETWQFVSKIDERIASFRPRPEAWSIKDHVAHLVAVEEAIVHFAHRILQEDCPISPLCHEIAFSQDAWNNREVAQRAGYTWAETLQTAQQIRQELLRLLDQTPEAALNRLGSHPVWGEPVTLASILRLPYRHERAHRAEIGVLSSLAEKVMDG